MIIASRETGKVDQFPTVHRQIRSIYDTIQRDAVRFAVDSATKAVSMEIPREKFLGPFFRTP
jgi:hypothetical protein